MAKPCVYERHATFIAKRLAITFGVLAVAPFFLAFHGAPTGAETLIFACSFAPLAAALVAARTGHLAAAHGIAFLGLIGMSLSLWLGLGCGSGCAIAWLVTAQLEATLAGDRKLALAAGALTGVVLVGILVVSLHGDASLSPAAAIPGAFAGLALAYATVIAAGAWRVVEAPRRRDGNEEQMVQLVSELAGGSAVRFDASGTVLGLLTDCEANLGVPAAELMGRGFFAHVHVADRPCFLKHIADAAHGLDVKAVSIRISTTAGRSRPEPPRYRWMVIAARADAAPHDGVRAALAFIRAVDAASTLEGDRRAETSGAAETGLDTTDHFLANVSHELRTPLNAIIGFSEMLASRTLRPAEADKQREYARIINQSGQHLLSVVNAILDISKIRSGTASVVPETFAIKPLIDSCCEMVALQAEDGQVHIVRDVADPIQDFVGDKRACRQIVINLLCNAVKFTPAKGHVTIAARKDGGDLLLSVSDTGIGIAAPDLAKLGHPFFQADAQSRRPSEGTGLGLSVVRALVGLHGGTIEVESEPGRGTRVDIRLPLDGRDSGRPRTSAIIETFPRRTAPEQPVRPTDARTKKIA